MEEYRKHPTANEIAIKPDLPIVDTHHHLWTEPPVSWLPPCYDDLAYDEDVRSSGHNVIATVYVDSHSNYRKDGPKHLRVVGETEYCEKVANEAVARGPGATKLCSAIVSTANLMLGEGVAEILDAHMDASTRFRGIRHMMVDPTASGMDFGDFGKDPVAKPEYCAGFRELELRNLSYEAEFDDQKGHLLTLAKAHPGVPIIIQHLGYAGAIKYMPEPQRSEAFAHWRDTMRAFAELDNVYMKLGGMNGSRNGGPSPAEASLRDSADIAEEHRPFYLTAIDVFGPDRCMFESNFPVDGLFTSMTTLWNVFKRVSQDFSESERADLFVGTARRAYRF
jgi:predicted TIM-barrel fold metal-dependent hydrolase